MPAIDFPNSPVINDTYTIGNKTWTWDGIKWNASTPTKSIDDLSDVDFLNLTDGDALLYNAATQTWGNGEVDVQGAIDTANAYTDSAVSDLTDYIDGYLNPSTGTTTDYIDQQDAITLAAANTYTDTAIDNLVGLAPESLDTLSELAAAINNDPDFLTNLDVTATTVSEDAPTSPTVGDAWFRSSTGQFFVYYDSFWIEIGAGPKGDPGVVTAVAPLSYDAQNQSVSIDLSEYKVEINETTASNINVLAGHRYFIDTSAARTLTLPATPAVGDEIHFIDSIGSAETYATTVLNNGEKIDGILDTLELNMNFYNARLIYTGSSYGWRIS